MSQLQNTKSILAKLLATENITISHQPIKTAYFDLQSRTLVCPVWQDMDGELYDLLMGHEVGHATETPPEGWHNALKDENGKPVPAGFKDFLNVLEDARIEKKIKRRYPGLARSFASAYKSLHERNFFEIRDMDLNQFNFIDRINVYYKLGAHMHVPWRSDWEREIVGEVARLETWEEVVELAKKIFEYVKEEEEPQIKNENDLQQMMQQRKEQLQEQMREDFGDDAEDQDEDYNDSDDSDDYQDADGSDYDDEDSSDGADGEDADGGGSEGEGDVDEDSEESESSSNTSRYNRQRSESQFDSEERITEKLESENSKDEDPQSVTDRAFRRREQELVNETGKVYMLNLPEANLDKIIMPNKLVMDDLESFIKKQLLDPTSVYGRNKVAYETLATKCLRKFNNRNKKFIMHIFKEFDMRKRATDYARTSIARSGELNMNVLHKYKFSNDLFKKISVVQKGKNHGLIMFVDMSGSMHDILRNTIEQTMVLVSFCKLANIPFDVYAFTNDSYYSQFIEDSRRQRFKYDHLTEIAVDAHGFHLKHLIGSSLSATAYRRSFNNLAIVINEYSSYGSSTEDTGHFPYDWTSSGFGLNGTPYIETLLASREIIKKFRASNKLDIVNVLYLTDGEGNTQLHYPPTMEYNAKVKSTIYFVDKKTQRKIRFNPLEGEQVTITKLVREVTGCKHLGFYLADRRSMRDALARVHYDIEHHNSTLTMNDYDDMRRCIKENKFFAAPVVGYNKYFFIESSKKNIEEDKIEITADMTKTKMANAFKKSLVSKKNNRILVSKFAEELAVGL